MKKLVIFIAAALLLFSVLACKASGPDADIVRTWKKAEWQAAAEKDRIAALAAIIAADRDDVDAQASAELSVEGFNSYFASVTNEDSLTLGEVFDESVIEEDVSAEAAGEETASDAPVQESAETDEGT